MSVADGPGLELVAYDRREWDVKVVRGHLLQKVKHLGFAMILTVYKTSNSCQALMLIRLIVPTNPCGPLHPP